MGPLKGIRIVEIAGIGPAPFAGMLLSDLGADVILVDRLAPSTKPGRGDGDGDGDGDDRTGDLLRRGRRSIAVDLKNPEGVRAVLALAETADVFIEGFRPGVAERLGIGPGDCMLRNPRLIYGRMTGWGQDGPYSTMAGHDINYIALAGVLGHIGRVGQAPVPPINLVGDFGGGGMLLALGVCAALLEARATGRGQVIDAAMVDGSALLMTMMHSFNATGGWGERGTNMLDSGAPFYDVYQCSDGEYVSIGSIEPQFYAELMAITGLDESDVGEQHDRSTWPRLKARLAAAFATRTRSEWCALMEGTDVCFAPVLSMDEAAHHRHNRDRSTFLEIDGVTQPAPAPRFSRTPAEVRSSPARPGAHSTELLAEAGFDDAQIAALRACGAVGD